jgi:DNA helicase IV
MTNNYKAALKQSRKDIDVTFSDLESVYGVVEQINSPTNILYRILNSDTPIAEIEAVKADMYSAALAAEMAEKGYELEEPSPSLHEGRRINLAGKTRRLTNDEKADALRLQMAQNRTNNTTINIDGEGNE